MNGSNILPGKSADRFLSVSSRVTGSCILILFLLLVIPFWAAIMVSVLLGGLWVFIAAVPAGKPSRPYCYQSGLLEDQLKGVKLAKLSNDYPTALKNVNEILEQDPYHPEAHFFKAQILHDGFDNPDGAKKHLKFAVSHSKPKDAIHTRASSYLNELEQG